MQNKRKLILDLDSTIADTIKAYCDTYNEEFSNHPNFIYADYTKVNRWDLKDECPLVSNPDDCFLREELFNNLKPFPNAVEVIYELSKIYDICICTIGGLQNLAHKTWWLEKYFPFIKNVILISNEGIKMDKSIVNMNGAIFIDDHENNLLTSNASVKICFGKEYSWNRQWTGKRLDKWDDTTIDRIRNWESYENDINLHNLRNYYINKLHKGDV